MELYKLRYNLYNYFFQDTIDYNFSNSYLILWEYSLYALYAIFLLIILFNLSKINKFTLFFLIIFSILIYMFTIIDIKIKTIIDNKDLSNYILHFKLFNTIFIDSYNTNKIPLAFSTTFTSEDDITLKQIKTFIDNSHSIIGDNVYNYITFNENGSFDIKDDGPFSVELLIIGGGGGGASGTIHWNGAKYPGGGGGAGQLYYNNNFSLTSGTHFITIGSGGFGGTSSSEATKGGDTILTKASTIIITANGGGAGANGTTPEITIMKGGSGGGIGCRFSPPGTTSGGYCVGSGGTADPTTAYYFGNNGNIGVAQDGGGGGGGAGGAGSMGYYGGGTGGDGKSISITGSDVFYAGGGGGGGGASGGKGGGGRGGTLTTKPENGATFTGSGGGGGYDTGGNGGSGIVIIKYNSKNENRIFNFKNSIKNSFTTKNINLNLYFITETSSDYLFIKEQSQIDDNNLKEINELIKYNYNILENKGIISIETINNTNYYKINIKKFDENKRTSKIIQVLTKKIQKYFYDTYNTIPKINTEIQQEFNYLQTLIQTDTKNYLYNFYNTLKIINNEIRYIDNIEENKIYSNNDEYIKNNNILKFIDIYDSKYLILKKYIFIKIDVSNELHKYITDYYDIYKASNITPLLNINTNNDQLIKIRDVIIDISASYSPDSKTYFLIDIETINKYFNKNKDEKNDHINDYIVYIYDNLKLYYSNKIGIKIENFDILYDSNSKLLLKNLNKPIDEFKLNFNINLVVVIILLTIILHIFYIEYYYKFR